MCGDGVVGGNLVPLAPTGDDGIVWPCNKLDGDIPVGGESTIWIPLFGDSVVVGGGGGVVAAYDAVFG